MAAKLLKKKFFKVNLLIVKDRKVELYVRAIHWLIVSGRFIVVIVEIIVVAAFIYRYKLDADIANLQEKISEQIPYIKSLENDENLIRQTQFQLSTIKQLREGNSQYSQVLTKIAALTPVTIKLTNVTLSRTDNTTPITIMISGQTPSSLDLSAFISALQNSPAFNGVTLTGISFEGQADFTISAKANSNIVGGTS